MNRENGGTAQLARISEELRNQISVDAFVELEFLRRENADLTEQRDNLHKERSNWNRRLEQTCYFRRDLCKVLSLKEHADDEDILLVVSKMRAKKEIE